MRIELKRTLDASFLNRVANDPEVRPWLGCMELGCAEGLIDLSVAVADLANVALVCDAGGFLLTSAGDREYEVHSMFLPASRRGITVPAMRAGFEYMFTRTDCQRIVTKVPDDNAAAAGLARLGGFTEKFRREGVWNGGGVSYQAITLDSWAMGCAALEAHGEWFHEQLEVAKRADGSELPTHPHDPAHERAVGAAVLMIGAGQTQKGVRLYNRWASLAGYQSISVLSVTPTILDVRDAIVEVHGDQMEVLLCR